MDGFSHDLIYMVGVGTLLTLLAFGIMKVARFLLQTFRIEWEYLQQTLRGDWQQ